jgi:hypothetical protein
MNTLSKEDLHTLLAADTDELYSLLGAAALTVDTSPIQLLEAGRSGQLYATGPTVLGPESPFLHKGLRKSAETFLGKWAVEIRQAICGNAKLYEAERKEAGHQVDLWVATIVSTLTLHIEPLAPFVVVLNIIGIMVARSGLKAFCDEVLPVTSQGGK